MWKVRSEESNHREGRPEVPNGDRKKHIKTREGRVKTRRPDEEEGILIKVDRKVLRTKSALHWATVEFAAKKEEVGEHCPGEEAQRHVCGEVG